MVFRTTWSSEYGDILYSRRLLQMEASVLILFSFLYVQGECIGFSNTRLFRRGIEEVHFENSGSFLPTQLM